MEKRTKGDDWGEIEREYDRLDHYKNERVDVAMIATMLLMCGLAVFTIARWITMGGG